MTAQPLKPCPFCGSDKVELFHNDDYSQNEYSVACTECEAVGPEEKTKKLARLKWNQRKNNLSHTIL